MNSMASAVQRIRQRLERGAERTARRRAQSAFSPELSFGRHFGPPAHNARRSAVMIALFQREGQWRTTLTRRPTTLRAHAGQICFPGGAIDPGEDAWRCAIREWSEELGEPAEDWRRAGTLSPLYVFNSNHVIQPCVATTAPPPAYDPSPVEVADVLEPPFGALLDPQRRDVMRIERWGGAGFHAPCVRYGPHRIWGATAVILAELALLLGDLLTDSRDAGDPHSVAERHDAEKHDAEKPDAEKPDAEKHDADPDAIHDASGDDEL